MTDRYSPYGQESSRSLNTPQPIVRKRKQMRKKIQAASPRAVVVFHHGECFVDSGDGFERRSRFGRINIPLLRRPGGNIMPDNAEPPMSPKQRLAAGDSWFNEESYYTPRAQTKPKAGVSASSNSEDKPANSYWCRGCQQYHSNY